MGRLRQSWIRLTGLISWRNPNSQARLMSKFAATEQGSSYDMLSALENTQYPELRQKYLHHALDEARHARIFRRRALALGVDRELAALIDIGYLHDHGILGGETLFERLGEHEFLAFVHDAEQRGLEHFLIYLNSPQTDNDTKEALKGITKDEHFHRSYSKAALDKYACEQSTPLLQKVRRRRYKEAWMRIARTIGSVVSGFWLHIVYFLLVFPFRILARPDKSGWYQTQEGKSLEYARQQF
jgi:hypothetical protein